MDLATVFRLMELVEVQENDREIRDKKGDTPKSDPTGSQTRIECHILCTLGQHERQKYAID